MAASFDIGDRYNKTVRFRKYLEDQWHFTNVGAIYYDFVALLQSQDVNFSTVKQAIDRNENHH